MTPEDAVSRILFPVRGGGHSSGTGVAAGLEQPTRAEIPPRGRSKDGPSLTRRLFGLAPGGGCLAAPVTRRSGGLLPRHFTLACGAGPQAVSFSVALSLGSPPAAVSGLPALWCPDFPPTAVRPSAVALHPPASSLLSHPQGSQVNRDILVYGNIAWNGWWFEVRSAP